MQKRHSERLNLRALMTMGLFVAAAAVSACSNSSTPSAPFRGPSGNATPTPTPGKPTPTPLVTPTPTGATPTPTPPPSGGGVAAACVLTVTGTGKTYAFVPAFSAADTNDYPDSLAEVPIANGTTILRTGHRSTTLSMHPLHYHRVAIPNQRVARAAHSFITTEATAVSPIITYTPAPAECAADTTHSNLYLMSNGSDYPVSPIISVVNVNQTTAAFNFVTNFTTDATGTFEYSGGTFSIGGIAYDPNESGVVISTATGYEVYSVTSPYAQIKTIAAAPSENFGFNVTTDQIFSPVYQVAPSNLNAVTLSTGTAYTYAQPTASPVTFEDPDSGSVDTVTNIAVSPEEFEQALYLVGLNAATYSGSGSTATYGAPINDFVITGPLVDGIAEQSDAGLTDSAIDSPNHLLFLAGEFGTTGMCVVALPTTAASLTPSDYACATFPVTPDSQPFSSPLDPHATSTFELGGKPYGLIFNGQYTYVAVIDLKAILAAPRDPSDPHAVTSASALSAAISYVQI